jgi:uncharacterized protein (DUF736 family)
LKSCTGLGQLPQRWWGQFWTPIRGQFCAPIDNISITLADPQIGPRKIFANLAPVKGKKGRHVILWNPKE